MTTIINNVYKDTTVVLDNTDFQNCKFENCLLVFSGTGPVAMTGCVLNKPRWQFVGPAKTTIGFLRAVYHGMGEGGPKLVEEIIASIITPSSTGTPTTSFPPDEQDTSDS